MRRVGLAFAVFLGLAWGQGLQLEVLSAPEAKPRQALSLLLRVTNPGPTAVEAEPRLELPTRWQMLLPPEPVKLKAGEAFTLLAVVQPPAQLASGEYTLRMRLEGGPGVLAEALIRVRVAQQRGLSLTLREKPDSSPAAPFSVQFLLTNTGTDAEDIRLRAGAGLCKELRLEPAELRLAAGQSQTIRLHATPPARLSRIQTDTLWLSAETAAPAVSARAVATLTLFPPPASVWARHYTLPAEVGLSYASDGPPRFTVKASGQPFDGRPDRLSFHLEPGGLLARYERPGLGFNLHKAPRGSLSAEVWGGEETWDGRLFGAWDGSQLGGSLNWRPAPGRRLGLSWSGQAADPIVGANWAQSGVILPAEWLPGCDLEQGCPDFAQPPPIRYGLKLGYGRRLLRTGEALETALTLGWGGSELALDYERQGQGYSDAPLETLAASFGQTVSPAFGWGLNAGLSASRGKTYRLGGRLSSAIGPQREDRLEASLGLQYAAETDQLSGGFGLKATLALPNGTLRQTAGLRAAGGAWGLGYEARLGQRYGWGDLEAGLGLRMGSGTAAQVDASGAATIPLGQGTLKTGLGLGLGAQSSARFELGYSLPFDLPILPRRGIGEVAGRVTDADGRGIGGVVLVLGELAATTDASGRFYFPAAPAGKLTLSAVGGSFISTPALPYSLELQAGQRLELEFRFQPARFLRGAVRVVYPERPEPGVSYGLAGADEARLVQGLVVELEREGRLERGLTDEFGRFAFGPLPPGRWRVKVYWDRLTQAYALENGELEVQLDSSSQGELEFRVRPLPRRINFEQEQPEELP
ncbi:MAG: hypothetical protein SFU83_21875 [Meiothermus sp.]|nr:hypothetical protein [Meiothermus sp.]